MAKFSEREADKNAQHLRLMRDKRKLTKHLRDLTVAVTQFLVALDTEMAKPSNHARGGNIALLSNRLNLQNDISRRFGLDQQE